MITFLSQIPFLNTALIACLLSGLVFIFLRANKKYKGTVSKYPYIFMLVFYGLLLISILFYPSVTHPDEYIDVNYFQLIPFKSIVNFVVNRNYIQILGGIIITIPIVPLTLLNFKGLSLKTTSLITSAIVLLIEPLQLLINILTKYPNKIIDIDDLILNSVGLLISICLIKGYQKILNKAPAHI